MFSQTKYQVLNTNLDLIGHVWANDEQHAEDKAMLQYPLYASVKATRIKKRAPRSEGSVRARYKEAFLTNSLDS